MMKKNDDRNRLAFVGFAGFGLVDIVLREFGFEVVGVEIDEAIAAVNRRNGGDVITADILDTDPVDYIGFFLTHFSPPCPSYSVARNAKARQNIISRILDLACHQKLINGEGELDIRFARKICGFIRVIRPEIFTLENVWGYRKSLSWRLIWYTLLSEGYGVDVWNLNAADYGVPQSRRRMIVIARRDGRQPAKPFQTHSKKPDMFTRPWVGWYEALEDLLPELPESKFAPWQEDRMPEEVKSFMIPGDNTSNMTVRSADEPMVTIQTRMPERYPHRAFLVGHRSINISLVERDDPAYNTITAQSQRARAFLLGQGSRSKPKYGHRPADIITANNNQTGIKAFVAFVMDSGNTRSGTVRNNGDPIFTIPTMGKIALPKAFIIGGQHQTHADGSKRTVQNRGSDRPVWTIRTSEKGDTRALLAGGKVVSLTPRALARLQDFPDWFVLPVDEIFGDWLEWAITRRELSCRGIGNALPRGVYRAVLKSL